MRYWQAHDLDPRSKNSTFPFSFPKHFGLFSKAHLVSFWKNKNTKERRKIVGKLGYIVQQIIAKPDDVAASFTEEFDVRNFFFNLCF
jgi:hypothetical protein